MHRDNCIYATIGVNNYILHIREIGVSLTPCLKRSYEYG